MSQGPYVIVQYFASSFIVTSLEARPMFHYSLELSIIDIFPMASIYSEPANSFEFEGQHVVNSTAVMAHFSHLV